MRYFLNKQNTLKYSRTLFSLVSWNCFLRLVRHWFGLENRFPLGYLSCQFSRLCELLIEALCVKQPPFNSMLTDVNKQWPASYFLWWGRNVLRVKDSTQYFITSVYSTSCYSLIYIVACCRIFIKREASYCIKSRLIYWSLKKIDNFIFNPEVEWKLIAEVRCVFYIYRWE